MTQKIHGAMGTGYAARFEGAQVLVTGAGSGIGSATARLLAGEGAHVYGFDRDPDALEHVGAVLGRDRFSALHGDVTSPDDRAAAIERAAGQRGTLDILVNNAGVFIAGSVEAGAKVWDPTLAINLQGPAYFTADAVEVLARSNRASVVNVASVSAHVAQVGRSAYSATKAALLALTRCQAVELGPRGIRSNSVSPGYIWTELVDAHAQGNRELWEKTWGSFGVLKRCGEPHEVAAVIAFLASQQASFVTGVDIPVDGGYLATGPEGSYDIEADMAAAGKSDRPPK